MITYSGCTTHSVAGRSPVIAPALAERSSRLGVTNPTNKIMEYVVYILYSKKRLRYYVGQTQNIEERLTRHNNGFVPSTKSGKPWELVKVISVRDRTEALKLEKKIKKRGIKRFLEDNLFGV